MPSAGQDQLLHPYRRVRPVGVIDDLLEFVVRNDVETIHADTPVRFP